MLLIFSLKCIQNASESERRLYARACPAGQLVDKRKDR